MEAHTRVLPSGAMADAARQRFTFGEYLALEEMSPVKHEFLGGQAWAMAGGTPEHAAICASVIALLHAQLRGKTCRVFSADLRVRVRATGLATYPDVTVVCGRMELDPDDPKGHTITNPRVLVEVLSPSAESYDRGEKLDHYRQIASLCELVLIAHDRRAVTIHRKGDDGGWQTVTTRGDDVVRIASLDAELPLADVYADPLGG